MRSILIWPTKLQNICIAANAKEATEKFWQQPSIAWAKLAGAAYCSALGYGQAGCQCRFQCCQAAHPHQPCSLHAQRAHLAHQIGDGIVSCC